MSKKITRTICDSVNHIHLPKEVLLPDWARWDKKDKKGDRVEYNPCSTVALGSAQPLIETSIRNIFWGVKAASV